MSKSNLPCDAAAFVASLAPPTLEEVRNGVILLDCCEQGCGVEIHDCVKNTPYKPRKEVQEAMINVDAI